MEVIHDLLKIVSHLKGGVVVIGNFDGVHLGHQAVLKTAKEKALSQHIPCGVLTFEPHPRRLFRPDDPPGRLTPFDFKMEKLAQNGVDFATVLPFDWDFASRSAASFIDDVLIDALGARHVIVGSDFRFGQLRQGTPDMIRQAGIEVSLVDGILDRSGVAYSSSRARQALRQGDVAAANVILGWDWEIRGEVVKGDQRGRELGYPTANVMLGDTIHPAYGIYAAFAQVEGDPRWYKSAVNIGIRPMFEVPVAQLEAHLLDFDFDIYGKILKVQPLKRLRGEAKFDSLDALIQQIELDCQQAEQFLQSTER